MPSSPEVLVQFGATITSPEGLIYLPRACTRQANDGRWEGWIEFVPTDGGPVLSSPRETIQPNRTDVAYWARGLTLVYLEGAFQRASDSEVAIPRTVETGRPAVGPANPLPPSTAYDTSLPRPVLDPFQVYSQGEEVLRQQLRALDVGHLEQIVKVYNLPVPAPIRDKTFHDVLEAAIITGVQRRVSG